MASTAMEDVLDLGQRVALALELTVQGTHVIHCSDGSILLWDDEERQAPFRFTDSFKGVFLALSCKFILESLTVDDRNWIRLLGMIRDCIFFQVNVELLLGALAKGSIKEGLKLEEHFQ